MCLYWAGMAANDWADRDLDARERPERPIPSGRISPRQALGVAAGLTAAGVGLAALAGGRRAAVVAVPLAGTIWAYDVWAKNTAAGPPVMAACRGLDVLLGAGSDRIGSAAPAALTIAAHTATVTALSRREVSGGDSALPAATLAGTVALAALASGRRAGAFPAMASGRRAGAFPAVANGRRAGVPPGEVASVWGGGVSTALAAWYAVWYGKAQARAVADPSATRIRAAVGAGITGLPPLQGALTAGAGAPVTGLILAAAAPLARRLTRWVSAT